MSMRFAPQRRLMLASMLSIAFAATAAEQTTQTSQGTIYGTPGAPDATIVIKGDQLPSNPLKFGGKINKTTAGSKPYWDPGIAPKPGAPNILLIITDDSGFGVPSTFGGVIPTPALDRIANNGLRYTNMHSTALSSPTRAALITGRNHHSVGFGVIAEQATGYPGYNSVIEKNTATIGRIMKDNGYSTAWFGKNHNTPSFQASQAGPFDQWPTGMGFEYFYGFMGGDTTQWEPGNLVRNTTPIMPYVGKPDWNLTTAMADDAIEYMNRINALTPDKPFLIKYAPGGVHAPHHPTKEWVDKISAMHLFDGGWNKLREQIFANQKKLGVIPANTTMAPWPKDLLKEWDQLTPDEQKMFIRQADVFAAYVAYTDHEIGRVIQAVDDMGKLDNTLVIYINGDNGTSAEGTLIGTPNEVAMFNSVDVPVDVQLKDFYDVWGTRETYNHMAVGWAWAFDTPFKWTKQVVSGLGGVRQGMAVSWPAVIKDKGGMRHQFAHVIDVVPTIMEAAGVKSPDVVDGVKQKPIEGTSFVYTFDAKNANAPTRHRTQYFEMMANQAIYHDGWFAGTKVMRAPWVHFETKESPLDYPWELYNLNEDWAQANDLAAKNPAKLAEMKKLFWQEAKKFQVEPLDGSVVTRLITPKPSVTAGRTHFEWTKPLTFTPNGDAPSTLNKSYTITADVVIPEEGGNGMLITQGGRFSGFGLYLQDKKPVFMWNLLDLKRVTWEGPELAPGRHVLEFSFDYAGLGMGTLALGSMSGIGQGGTGVFKVDGKVVATETLPHTIPFILQWDENLDIGSDTGSPITDSYAIPFAFNGTINKITMDLKAPVITAADKQKLLEAAKAKAVHD